MTKSRKSSIRKERIIMFTSSAFVLAALTMTGLYMRGQEAKQRDDGYTLDFAALENSTDRKYQEIADNMQAKADWSSIQDNSVLDNDLDYLPMEDLTAEAGSHLVEIPGLTDSSLEKPDKTSKPDDSGNEVQKAATAENDGNAKKETDNPSENPVQKGNGTGNENKVSRQGERELHFSEDMGLIRPVSGEVLLPYSMSGSIYFKTLDQYKYNPATVFRAEEGEQVNVCAEGKVIDIYEDRELGRVVVLDIGDGYTVTYGQLYNIQVNEDDYVEAGSFLATVCEPTKYYSAEGSNLYFRVERDGKPLDAERLF